MLVALHLALFAVLASISGFGMNFPLSVGEAIGANIGQENVVGDCKAAKLRALALGCHVEDTRTGLRDECILTEEAAYIT